MTMSGAFDDGQEVAPSYPQIFGISFTPTIIGVLAAAVGLAGGAYLFVSFVQPSLQKYQELETAVSSKQAQVEQQAVNRKKVQQAKEEIETAKRKKADVMSLFAGEETLNTLLLDINRQFVSLQAPNRRDRQGRTVSNPNPQLLQFNPQGASTVVNDASLGAAVAGKLKRRDIALTMKGNFAQTVDVIRSIEQLQPLLVVKGFKTQVTQVPVTLALGPGGTLVPKKGGDPNKPNSGPAQPEEPFLTTSFTIQALVPLTQAELDEAAKAAAAKAAPPKK